MGKTSPRFELSEWQQKFKYCPAEGCGHGGPRATNCPEHKRGVVKSKEKLLIERDAGFRENSRRDHELEAAPHDILLNPLTMPDRFGQGIKNGELYYGVPVADNRGKVLPAIFYRGRLIFGKENLEASGFNIKLDYLMHPKTWERERLHEYITRPTPPIPTKELVERIVRLNQRFIRHEEDGWHWLVAAYIVFTYIFSAFSQAARLVFLGDPDSGKSTQTDLIAMLAANPTSSADASKATLFRSVEVMAGLVAVDNFDNLSDELKSEFVQLYDTSFEQGRPVLRCDEKTNAPRSFRTFCPMTVNCVKTDWMGESSLSRSILCRMVKSDAKIPKLRDVETGEVHALQHELRVWAIHNVGRIQDIAKSLSDFSNREQDIAAPLLAILSDAEQANYEKVRSLLTTNFQEHHAGPDRSPTALILLPIWERIKDEWLRSQKMQAEFTIANTDIARMALESKGIFPADSEGHPNRNYSAALHKESISVSFLMRNIPSKISRPKNAVHFTMNIKRLARFVKVRGFELGEDADELLFNPLGGEA